MSSSSSQQQSQSESPSPIPSSPLKQPMARRLSCSTPLDLSSSAVSDSAGTAENTTTTTTVVNPSVLDDTIGSVLMKSSSGSNASSHHNASSQQQDSLFFNADASTRKVLLPLPISMLDLRHAFAKEMQLDFNTLPPLYIRDRFTNIEYELQSTDDVYPMAFITIRVNTHHHYNGTASNSSTVAVHAQSAPLAPVHDRQSPLHNSNPGIAASYLRESMVLRRQKLVLVTVGKPACGKTFVAQKLARYLNWNGLPTKVFSVAEHRRAKVGFRAADFYDPSNADGVQSRESMALETLDALIAFLNGTSSPGAPGGMAAIFDANNSTVARRNAILKRLRAGGITPSEIMFLEIRKSTGNSAAPDLGDAELDYSQLTPDDARSDLDRRMQFYTSSYEPLSMDAVVPDAEIERPMLVQLCPEDHQIAMRDVRSHVSQRIASMLMNIGTRKKKIWFSRHGESLYNLTGQLGGNSDLSERGHSYAKALSRWFAENVDQETRERMVVVTSTLIRTINTSRHFDCERLHLRSLDEIDAGICDGLTYDGIAREYPEEAKARAADKYRYRYPRGESYVDVVQRLEPVLLELERVERPVLVISHQAIMRVLVSYFRDIAPEKIPHMDMPLHTLVEITPSVGSLQMKEYKLID